jgi:hypothetical protein
MCEEYNPKITEQSRAVLGGERTIQGSISGLISERHGFSANENEGVHNLQRALTMIVTSRDSAFFQRRGQRNVAATLQHKVSIL